ncbi:MAG: 30S ribosomal protein S6e [candidate division WOR-3 bacterium]
MAKFKIIVSDPKTGGSKAFEIEGARAIPLIGKRIGDIIDGSVVGMPGVKLMITGGSDKDGFPMRPDVHGGVKTEVLLSGGVGFKPKNKGERRRRTVRGNVITEDIVQVNVRIVEEESKETKMSEM